MRRTPALVGAYRRWLAPVVSRDKRHPRFSRWARHGTALIEELGTREVRFDRDGVWVRDRDGLEWAYEPGVWLSALGKELGFDYDVSEIAHVKASLRPGGAFVDIGAHVGGYAMPVAAAIEDIEIHAFEPVPRTRAILTRNLDRNGLADRVTVWPAAVGDVGGRQRITTFPQAGENRLLGDDGSSTGSVEVEVVTLDQALLDRCPRIDVIKCDIEGGELAALRGAESLLYRDKPEVLAEVDVRFSGRFDGGLEELIGFMAGVGYGWLAFAGGALADETALQQGTNNLLFTAAERRRGHSSG